MFVKGLDGKQVLIELSDWLDLRVKQQRNSRFTAKMWIFLTIFLTPSLLSPSESLRCGTKKKHTHTTDPWTAINDLKPQLTADAEILLFKSLTFNQRDNSPLAAQAGLRKLKRGVLSERRLCSTASSKRVLHVFQHASVCFRILLTGLAVQLWKKGGDLVFWNFWGGLDKFCTSRYVWDWMSAHGKRAPKLDTNHVWIQPDAGDATRSQKKATPQKMLRTSARAPHTRRCAAN